MSHYADTHKSYSKLQALYNSTMILQDKRVFYNQNQSLLMKLLILRQFRNLISTAVLDPDIKMSYFNKYWSPSLQKRVLHEAEKIVCPSILSFYNC